MCEDHDNSSVIESASDLGVDVKFSFHSNYGADIAPFLSQLKTIEEPVFIKIHSKKSFLGHYKHINWRPILVHSLIGSRSILNKNLNKILNDSNVGLISNKDMVLDNKEYKNGPFIENLCNLLDISYADIKNSKFVAGSMFMSRTEVFKQKLTDDKIKKILNLLSTEKGRLVDTEHGTYSHALERIFTYLIQDLKLLIDYPDLNYKFVVNDNFSDGIGKLIELYSKNCYIDGNIDVFGTITKKTSHNLTIQWNHIQDIAEQNYIFLNNDTLINSNYYLDYINKYKKKNKYLSIEIISFIKNEEILIEQFLNHHLKIADKITIIDNGSTDNTVNILNKYIDNDKITVIDYPGDFKDKANICTQVMIDSECDLLIPLDADELIIYDDGLSLSCDASYIKKYLQQIDTLEQKYRIRRVYNKHPGDSDYFEIYRSDLQKMVFLKPGFIKTDTGFHHGETQNNKNPKETHAINISYLHYRFISKDRWIENTKAKLYARLGDKFNDLNELKKYISEGSPESNHAVVEWIRFLEEGVWCDLSRDISIKTPVDLCWK